MQTVEHENWQTLFDHIPITISFVLREEPALGRHKGTYTKMDNSYMESEEFLSNV